MSNKKYWLGLEELNETKALKDSRANEFRESLPFEDANGILDAVTPRRDFLKYLGFSTAAVAVAASCKTPVRNAMTYAIKPDNVTPGVSQMFATTFVDGGDAIPVVVKSREGRPIKIEGNTLSKFTEGGTSARVQASILSLYDNFRTRTPQIGGKETTWEALDKAVAEGMAKANGAPVYLVSTSLNSPTLLSIIDKFKAKYSNVKHVMYDAVSYSGMLDANQASLGSRVIPSYKFENAKTIVSIGADFLGTWLSPVEFAKQYSKGRKISKASKDAGMSKHYQIESIMTITGGSADERATCRPSEYGAVAVALLNAINGTAPSFKSVNLNKLITKAAADLKANSGLVVCGSNDVATQTVVNAINSAIGAYGKTINTASPYNTKKGNDADMAALVAALKAGQVGGIMFYGANPVYDSYASKAFAEALPKLALSLSFNDRNDETTQKCNLHAPSHHWLESWGDAEPKQGYVSLQQPLINPIFKTRHIGDSLLKWSGEATTYNDYFMNAWKGKLGGQDAFDKAIQDGVLEPATEAMGGGSASAGDAIAKIIAAKPTGEFDLVAYEKVAIGYGGIWSNNPWLQEMPDPITKCTWDNYVCMSPATAKKFGAELTDINEVQREKKVFEITANGVTHKLPVIVVPGMNDATVAVALGYGRDKNVGRAAASDGVEGGKNAYQFTGFANNTVNYTVPATVKATSETFPLAITQTHHGYEGRHSVVKETTLKEFKENPNHLYDERMAELHHFTKDYDAPVAHDEHGGGHGENAHATKSEHTNTQGQHIESTDAEHVKIDGEEHNVEDLYRKNGTLYPTYESPGLKWGMSIDLNSCIGCGACTIACQAENNVSVVGKKQVMLVHDMHWLRIDRYFTSTNGHNYEDIMDSDSIQTVFQPMMCQHCDNAPCENVCPVNATNHSSEGLNQMTYNRCIGTRYCANNCPYKVRRFNWRDWNGADSFQDNLYEDDRRDDINDSLTRMALNPDVSLRSRGVIEKCSFCVQRLQGAKTTAKREGRPLKDGEAISACAQACPTNAIVFGNINDTESEIYKVRNAENKERTYYVLEEIHVLPNVNYLYKVRNADIAGVHETNATVEHKAEAHHS